MFIVYVLIVVQLLHSSLTASIQGQYQPSADVPCYAMSGTLDGQCRFHATGSSIIHTEDSLNNGARYIDFLDDVACPRDCMAACCARPDCDTAIYEDKADQKCYMFSCGQPSSCVFIQHADYWTISKSPMPLTTPAPRPPYTMSPGTPPGQGRQTPRHTTRQPVAVGHTSPPPASTDCGSQPVIVLPVGVGEVDSSHLQLEPGSCQEWMIQSPSVDLNITISFSYLNLGYKRDGICVYGSRIVLGPMPYTVICGQLSSMNQVYTSQRNYAWIKLYTGSARDSLMYPALSGRHSFRLRYISRQPWMCEAGEFACRNGRCIYLDWLCNGASECGDYSDEENCQDTDLPHQLHETTMARRTTTSPAPASHRSICGYNEVYCYVTVVKGYRCLHNIFKCDGKRDCQNGEDEDPIMCGDELCNMRLENPTGWLASPGFPGLYPNNKQCGWVIHVLAAQSDTNIQLRFHTFRLQPNPDTDYVTVYDGPDETYPLIGRYNGANEPPSKIESSSSWVYIKFHSDSSVMYNGFNVTYQTKGKCVSGQSLCGDGEVDCYDMTKWCDGSWDCPKNGGDELGCYHCHGNDYSCGGDTGQCYHAGERCNGVSRCSNNADEQNCTPALCGPVNGTFLCENRRCIYESWTCDSRDDCGDYSDERHCFGSTKRVIVAAITGSMICALLLVILLGCSCKLYSLRTMERHGGPRHNTPMSRLYAEFMRRIAPPPYHEAMLTSRNFDEVQQELTRNAERRARRGTGRRESSRANATNQPADGANSESDTRDNVVEGDIATAESDVADLSVDQTAAADVGVRSGSPVQSPPSDSDTESADSDSDPGEVSEGQSDDDDSLLITTLQSDTAHGSDGDDVSDDLCILQVGGHDLDLSTGPEPPDDVTSIDTATTSLDSVEVTDANIVLKDSDDESSSENEDLHPSRGGMPKPDGSPRVPVIPHRASYYRRSSRGSVSSSESETFSTDDVPLVVFNHH